MYGIKTNLMKTNLLLVLAAASLLVSRANAQNENSSTPVALPTYVVEAERTSAAEQQVHLSLKALRDLARAPITVSVELPALKSPMSFELKKVAGGRLAKI